MKLATLFCFSIFSFSVFANTLFTGNQPRTNHTCTLEVLHTYSIDESELSDVRVNFVDGGHGASRPIELDFTVALNVEGTILSSTGANGRDTLQVEIANGSTGFASPIRYGVRFVHGTHFHSVQCQSLKL